MMMKSKKVGKNNKLIRFMYSMAEDVRSSVQVQSDDDFRINNLFYDRRPMLFYFSDTFKLRQRRNGLIRF